MIIYKAKKVENYQFSHVIKGTKGHEIYGKIKKYAKNYPCLEKYTLGV